MPITALPTAPSRALRPADFANQADAFLAALPAFGTEATALEVNVNAKEASAVAAAATATTKAGEASTSAGLAHGYAATADAKAGEAAGSASAAAASADFAEDKYLAMDKRYLGPKASDPSTDNQGAPLESGAVYYNTTTGKVMTWTGAAWTEGLSAVAGVSSLNGLTGDLAGFTTNDGAQTLTNKTIAYADNTMPGVQPSLVSGANIKTLNGASVLGAGDLAIGGGAVEFIAEITASDSATVDFETGFSATYDDYMLIAENVTPASSALPMLRVKAGGTYLSSSVYQNASLFGQDNSAYGSVSLKSAVAIAEWSSSSADQSFIAYFLNCNSSSKKNFNVSGGCPSVGVFLTIGSIATSNVVQGIRFMFDAGNVITGTFRLYGMKKS